VETIGKVRLALARGESIRSVSIQYRLSRNTVRKIARGSATEHEYAKREVRYPSLSSHIERLDTILEEESDLPAKQRRTAKKIFEQLCQEGFAGSYDTVRRYVKARKEERISAQGAYVPLRYGKAEAFQFDWSTERVEIGGVVRKVQVAQVRLCYSRLPFCMAFMRQETSMVIEAHIQAQEFFGGLCDRGIYDNPKTIVGTILKGKERIYNQRFIQLASHYLFEPVACTPASGWEKG
jgi:transposase